MAIHTRVVDMRSRDGESDGIRRAHGHSTEMNAAGRECSRRPTSPTRRTIADANVHVICKLEL